MSDHVQSSAPSKNHFDEKDSASTAAPKSELVLIHGWGINRQIWLPLLPLLTPSFHVTLLDIRGYTPEPDSQDFTSLTLEATVDDLLQQAPDKATWVGWSLGGTLALKAAMAQPSRIDRLILIGSTPRYLTADDWEWGMEPAVLADLMDRFQLNFHKGLKRFLLMQTSDRHRVNQIVAATATFHQPDWRTLNHTIKFLTESDLRPVIPQIQVPVASLIGYDDKIVSPRASAELQRLVPPELRIAPRAGSSAIVATEHTKRSGPFDKTVKSTQDQDQDQSRRESFFFSGGHLFFLDQPEAFASVLSEIIGETSS